MVEKGSYKDKAKYDSAKIDNKNEFSLVGLKATSTEPFRDSC